jgi:hypothetical protein
MSRDERQERRPVEDPALSGDDRFIVRPTIQVKEKDYVHQT